MNIEPEVQELIDAFVDQIGEREEELAAFKKAVDEITAGAEKRFADAEAALDVRFDANEVSEEEYLGEIRKEKEIIAQETKKKLDELLAGLPQE